MSYCPICEPDKDGPNADLCTECDDAIALLIREGVSS
jgi:hypothetical protein